MTEQEILQAPRWFLEEQADLLARKIRMAARGIGIVTIDGLHTRLRVIETRLHQLDFEAQTKSETT
jgi:hypothetical protein